MLSQTNSGFLRFSNLRSQSALKLSATLEIPPALLLIGKQLFLNFSLNLDFKFDFSFSPHLSLNSLKRTKPIKSWETFLALTSPKEPKSCNL